MPKSVSNAVSARQVFAKHGNMLRTSRAIQLGIHPRTLYELRDQGELERVGRGLYRLSSAPPLTSPDWVVIAVRIPRAVICLISALAHYGLTYLFTGKNHCGLFQVPEQGGFGRCD